jgi:hypothetical protein
MNNNSPPSDASSSLSQQAAGQLTPYKYIHTLPLSQTTMFPSSLSRDPALSLPSPSVQNQIHELAKTLPPPRKQNIACDACRYARIYPLVLLPRHSPACTQQAEKSKMSSAPWPTKGTFSSLDPAFEFDFVTLIVPGAFLVSSMRLSRLISAH